MAITIHDPRIKIYNIEDSQVIAIAFEGTDYIVCVDYMKLAVKQENVYWDVHGHTRVRMEYILKLAAGMLNFATQNKEWT